MKNELAKQLMAVRMMSGITLWFDSEKVSNLKKLLLSADTSSIPKLIDLDGRTINVASIECILNPEDIENETRIKNGQWQCKMGEWHDKREVCSHKPVVDVKRGVVHTPDGDVNVEVPVYA